MISQRIIAQLMGGEERREYIYNGLILLICILADKNPNISEEEANVTK